MVRAKAARTIAVLDAGRETAEVLIRQGGDAQKYRIERYPTRAMWHKLYSRTFYTVTVRGDLPYACTCEAGRRGKACKHVDGTRYLFANRVLSATERQHRCPSGEGDVS